MSCFWPVESVEPRSRTSSLKPLGKRADEVGEIHIFGSLLDIVVGNPIRPQADVALDRSGKQKRVLKNHAVTATKFGEVHLLHVDAVDFDRALLYIVEAHQKRDNRGLAGAGVADDGNGFAGFDGEGDVAENPVRLGLDTAIAGLSCVARAPSPAFLPQLHFDRCVR